MPRTTSFGGIEYPHSGQMMIIMHKSPSRCILLAVLVARVIAIIVVLVALAYVGYFMIYRNLKRDDDK